MVNLRVNLLGQNNEDIEANIRPLNLIKDSLSWYVNWFPKMYDLAGSRRYCDSHWDVPEIWTMASKIGDYRVVVIEAIGQIQGYIVMKTNHTGRDGAPCIYVAFLASAPWNRHGNINGRFIKNIGQLLMFVAVLYCNRYHKKIAVELHSLSEAEAFYRRIGMNCTGQSKENMNEYRLEESAALKLIRPILKNVIKEG